jgi:hypothetical protein
MGHRSNLFYFEQGRLFGGSHKQITLNMPGLVALGEEKVVAWLKPQELKEDLVGEIWDEVMTEAAIMVNIDQRELIFGFREWNPHFIPDKQLNNPYMGDALGEMFIDFVNYPDMWPCFLGIVQPLWKDWRIELALPAEFGVQEELIIRINDLKPPKILDVQFPPVSGFSELQKTLGFRLALALALGEDSLAFERLIS